MSGRSHKVVTPYKPYRKIRREAPPQGLVADELTIRRHFLDQGLTLRSWALRHSLHYPTVHKTVVGENQASRKDGVGQRIVELLNAELIAEFDGLNKRRVS
jgi:hypothetical protein